MRKKMAIGAIILYILYGIAMYFYFFHFAQTNIPERLKGSSADPSTFMTNHELLLSQSFGNIKNFLYFLMTPFEWLCYFLFIVFGLSKCVEKWSKGVSKYSLLQTAIYVFWLSIFLFVVMFPFNYISYAVSKAYNLSNQNFTAWMKDEVIQFWVQMLFNLVIFIILFLFVKKWNNKWWLATWLVSIPFTMFILFIQPVVIDPLYNDFYPLKDKKLETSILQLADQAHIPANHVYEVNMKEKTNSLNAYVTGIGTNTRIVLWDTTLQQLSKNEILFVMAHEMGHYVEKHIYISMLTSFLFTLIGLYIIAKILRHVTTLNKQTPLTFIPLFLLTSSILLFAVSPVNNMISRYEEKRADEYAINTTNNAPAAIHTFQKLTKTGLSQVSPPYLVKLFRYSHPTMLERITTIEQDVQKKR